MLPKVSIILLIILAVLLSAAGCTQSPAGSGTSGPASGISSERTSGAGQSTSPDAVTWINKAWAFNALGKFQDAADAVDKAAAIDPSAAGISFNRGWALAGLGRYQEASDALNAAITENPDSEIAWANKGFVLSHLGRCDEAKSAFNQALSLEPNNVAAKEDLKSISDHCIASAATTTQPVEIISEPPTAQITNAPQQVAENMNVNGVYNGATSEPRFTFSTPVVIVSLYDYHWNDGKGDTPGTITIWNVGTSQIYGPFATHGLPGQGGVQNALWETEPGITIPSGTYSVKDSNPATWSQNAQTGGAGMTHIVYQQTSSTAFTSSSVSTTQNQPTPMVTTQPAGTMTQNPSASIDLGSVWTVKEYGDMGNYDGKWVREKGTNTFDASWSGGTITDTIDVTSVVGNTITLHRRGNNGYYTGTISSDGTSITGKGSWYDAGETWTVTIA